MAAFCPTSAEKETLNWKALVKETGNENTAYWYYNKYKGDYKAINAALESMPKDKDTLYNKQLNDAYKLLGVTEGSVPKYTNEIDAQKALKKIVDSNKYPLLEPIVSRAMDKSKNTYYVLHLYPSYKEHKLVPGSATAVDVENMLLIDSQRLKSISDYNSYVNQERVNFYFHEMLSSGNYKLVLKDSSLFLDFTNQFVEYKKAPTDSDKLKIEKEIKSRISKEYIPGAMKSFSKRKFTFVDFLLNENDRPDAKDLNYTDDFMNKIRSLLSIQKGAMGTGTKMVKYSDTQRLYDTYGIYDQIVEGDDPYIVIHNDRGQLDISILDIVPYSIENKGGSWDIKKNILANFMSDEAAKEEGILMTNTVSNARLIKNGLLALNILNSTKGKVNIRRIGIVNMGLKNGGEHSVFMSTETLFRQLDALRKNQDFVNMFDPYIKSLLNNDSLFEKYDKSQDIIDALIIAIEETRAYLEEKDYDTSMHERHLNILTAWKNSHNDRELLNMLKERINYYDRITKRSADKSRRENKEIDDSWIKERHSDSKLSHMLYLDMMSDGNLAKQYSTDLYMKPKEAPIKMGVLDFWGKLPKFIHDEVVQAYEKGIDRLSRITTDKYKAWKGEKRGDKKEGQFNYYLEAVVKEYAKRNGIYDFKKIFIESPHEVFEPLFDKEEVMHTDGSKVQVAHRIHYERNERSKHLSDAQLALGKFIVESIEKYMKMVIRHEFIKDNGYIIPKHIDAMVDNHYGRNWQKGMIPIIPMQTSEYFGRGDMRNAFVRFIKTTASHGFQLDEVLSMVDKTDSEIYNLFKKQFYNSPSNAYGGRSRMELMGMEISNVTNEPIIKNDNYKKISTNLEQIMDLFVMDSLWKIDMENDFVPLKNAALITLKTNAFLNVTDTEFNNLLEKKYIDKLQERLINISDIKGEGPAEEYATMFMNLLYKATSVAGVGFSIPVGITSMTANQLQIMNEAIAASISNQFDTFTMKDYGKALISNVSDWKKAALEFERMQLFDHTRTDLMRDQKRKYMNRSLLTEHSVHWLNSITDYEARRKVMIAQLMHDGIWEALNDEGKYNPYKDKRLYSYDAVNNKYTQTQEQKVYMQSLINDLIKDGYPGQENSSVPLTYYSQSDIIRMDTIINMILAYFKTTATPNGDANMLIKVAMQFKKIMYTEAQKRFGGAFRGRAVVKSLAKREVIHGIDGPVAINIEPEYIGAWVEFANTIKDAFKYYIKGNKKQEYIKMDKLRKYSLAKTGLDLTWLSLIYVFFLIDWDREENGMQSPLGEISANYRFFNSVLNGMTTSMMLMPKQLINSFSIPIYNRLKALINIMTFDAQRKDYNVLIPAATSFYGVQQLFEDNEE